MQNNIPVPTDNIFKFYALFGLLLFVFSCGSLLYVNQTTNDTLMGGIVDLETLKQIEKPSRVEIAKIAVLEKKLEIAKADKEFFIYALGLLSAASFGAMYYGFKKWHSEVQPVLDETAKVQLEIAKLQLEELRRELGTKDKPKPATDKIPAAQPSTTSQSAGI